MSVATGHSALADALATSILEAWRKQPRPHAKPDAARTKIASNADKNGGGVAERSLPQPIAKRQRLSQAIPMTATNKRRSQAQLRSGQKRRTGHAVEPRRATSTAIVACGPPSGPTLPAASGRFAPPIVQYGVAPAGLVPVLVDAMKQAMQQLNVLR